LIETLHRKKYLIVSDSESNIDETKNRKNDVKEESSRTEVEFMDDWIESLRDKWRDFVEDISSTVNNENKIKETNRTGAEFLDDLFEILSDSWAEYVDEFSGSGDREEDFNDEYNEEDLKVGDIDYLDFDDDTKNNRLYIVPTKEVETTTIKPKQIDHKLFRQGRPKNSR